MIFLILYLTGVGFPLALLFALLPEILRRKRYGIPDPRTGMVEYKRPLKERLPALILVIVCTILLFAPLWVPIACGIYIAISM